MKIQFGRRKCFPRNGLKSKSLLEYQEEEKLVLTEWQFGIRPKEPQHRFEPYCKIFYISAYKIRFIQADIVPIYGARDKWNGLGIILDSFDNNSKGDNPIIMMHVNDGTKNYNHNEVIFC